MGSFGNSSLNNKNIEDIKESWEFNGEIYCKNINYGNLKGFVFIIEENNKNKIQIKGIIRKKYEKSFCINGFESFKEGNSIAYKIKKERNWNFDFPKEIIMTKIDKQNSIITGDINYGEDFIKLQLNLYLPKPKKEKKKIVINNFQYSLLKLKNPVDIISNSLCGMNNLINTCYINSSFQILIHIPQFIEIIKDNDDFEDNIICYINCIFNMILKNFKQNKPIINPSIFVDNFKKEHLEYYNHSQKDSEMFLEELIANINIELSILNDKRELHYNNFMTEKEKLFFDFIRESEEDSYYKINDLFYVCFIHEKKCELCQHISYYFDESTGLKLNFENTNLRSRIDLYTLIMDNFKNPVRIKSSFVCQKCKKSFYILETTRIAKLPKILILSLQKTNIDGSKKLPWIVKYDDEFGIKELVDIDLYKNGSCKYKIFGINNHIGSSTKSGHYFSTIYLEKLKSWFSFNDESVNQISDVTPNLNNYIIFYKQKNS